ncbi:MAG: hypothetical protein WCT16_04830 [Candidatus Buchananbacteria bacterium]
MKTDSEVRFLLFIGIAALVIAFFLVLNEGHNERKAIKVAEAYGFSNVVVIDQTNEVDDRGNSVKVFYCVATNTTGNPAVVKIIRALDNYWKIRVQGDLPDSLSPLRSNY